MTNKVGMIDVLRREVPLIVGYGGGVNSAAVLVWLRQHDIVPDLISFADTMGEKPETYDHIRDVIQPWLGNYFPQIVVVKNASPKAGDTSLEAECLRKATMPSRAFGMSSCAMRWKIEPQDKYLKAWPPARDAYARGLKPIKILGYDAGEDRRVSTYENELCRFWYPLFDNGIDRDGCLELLEQAGMPAPPKSACFFCPSSTKTEILKLAQEHPELMRRALAMEDKALDPNAIGARGEPHGLLRIKGLGRHWSWRSLIEADPEARAAMREAPVESCTVCNDG